MKEKILNQKRNGLSMLLLILVVWLVSIPIIVFSAKMLDDVGVVEGVKIKKAVLYEPIELKNEKLLSYIFSVSITPYLLIFKYI